MKTYTVVFARGMSEDVMELEDYIALKATGRPPSTLLTNW